MMRLLMIGCVAAGLAASLAVGSPSRAETYGQPAEVAPVYVPAQERARAEADAAAARRQVPDGKTVYAMAYPQGPGAPLSNYAAPDRRYPSVGGDTLAGAPYPG